MKKYVKTKKLDLIEGYFPKLLMKKTLTFWSRPTRNSYWNQSLSEDLCPIPLSLNKPVILNHANVSAHK